MLRFKPTMKSLRTDMGTSEYLGVGKSRAAVLQQGNCEGNDGHIFSIQADLKSCPVEYL